MRYQRARVDDGTSLITANLTVQRRTLLVDCINVLRMVVGVVQERHPVTIYGKRK